MSLIKRVATLSTSLLICLIANQPLLACHLMYSPLVLDLDGNGIPTANVLTSPVLFDMDGDGIAEPIGWTSAYDHDGFLWLDRNGNGAVDSGRELFGNATRLSDGLLASNGFVALAEYDAFAMGGNADNEITSKDAVYDFLRVWTDSNHNGRLDTGESHSLADLNIAVISLEYDPSDMVDGCMNQHRFKGRFIERSEKRSRSRQIHDIYFETVHVN